MVGETKGLYPTDGTPLELADAFCAGARPPQNGLEERLDMIVAQLSVIARELREMRESSNMKGKKLSDES